MIVEEEELKEMVLEGIRYRERMTQRAGGLLTLPAVMELLNYTGQDVAEACRERRLLAVVADNGELNYPACQFENGAVIPELRRIYAAAPRTTGWRMLEYLLLPEEGLAGRRPIDLIRGSPDDQETALGFAARLDE